MHGGTMTIGDADSSAPAQARRLRFDRYVLDLDRGCLLLDGNEVSLRPKTFAVLRYLVENAGRLVAKDDLFAAVWPNLAITDDALVQSVGELRRALGDDGPRLIKTIPRRGYRFESDVSVIAPIDASVTSGALDPPASHDDAQRSEPSVTSTFPTTALIGWRAGMFAALAVVILLAAGALLAGLASEWKFLGAVRPGGQITKTADIGAKPAIAVVPLVDQSDDAGREYFADGLTQDIINALGRFSSLTVMSWNAVFPYKGKPASPEEIRRSLAASYLVEGSVRRVADRVRVNAQLVDTRDGRVLWSARFDEALADVFALQDEITAQIVRALAIRLTQLEQRRVLAKPTANLEAYDYVLRARPALLRPTRANNAEARTLLRRAIELDPNYAAAYAGLAETYHIATALGWAESPTAFLSRAEELATKALSLDDSEVPARIVLARIHIFYQRYEQAETEIERAIAVNPNDARALAGRGNILMWSGQTDAAIETLELAQRVDPDLNSIDRFALSLAYYLKRRYDAAIEQAERTVRADAGPRSAHVVLAAAYAQHDRAEDAARVVRTIRRLNPTFDPHEFGTKFLRATDLEHLRDGLRKAGLYAEPGVPPSGN
jgi:adenylate cyclase